VAVCEVGVCAVRLCSVPRWTDAVWVCAQVTDPALEKQTESGPIVAAQFNDRDLTIYVASGRSVRHCCAAVVSCRWGVV
jgi:hypothetical protein